MNNIAGYTHFRSYHDSIKDLDKEDKRDILEAIDDFMFEDIEPDLDGFKKAIWSLIRPNLISSKNKSRNYQEKPKRKSKKTKSKSNENQNEINSESNENQIDVNELLENKDKNKGKNKKKNKEEEGGDVSINTTNIYNFLESNFGRTISSIEFEKLESWINEFNEDIVKHAIELSVMNNAKKFSYVEGILRNWKASGYKTLEDIIAYEDSVHNVRSNRSNVDLDDIFDYNWLEDDE